MSTDVRPASTAHTTTSTNREIPRLSGVPETLLIPLWARAVETRRPDPIVRDPRAVEIVDGLDYDFARFESAWLTQLGVSVRTRLLDAAVRNFVDQAPGAVVINLGAGLDTRFERLADRDIDLWYDLDVPPVMDLRRRFFGEDPRVRRLPMSVFDRAWMEAVETTRGPVLFIAEGLFMYFEEERVRPLLVEIAERFPGAEMLMEFLAPMMVGRSRRHDTLRRMGDAPEFKWGPVRTDVLESWSDRIRVADEWNYVDHHRERWRWFGLLGRLPGLRSRLASRIARIVFV